MFSKPTSNLTHAILGLVAVVSTCPRMSPVCGAEATIQTLRFESIDEDVINPERGFYRYRELDRSSGFEQVRASGYSLIYGRVLASDFRDRPLSDEFLSKIEAGFDDARTNGIKVKFRFAYSNGIGQPDAPIDIVLQHIEQLKPIWQRHKDVMFHMDAGFIGAWGEWHSSTEGLATATNRALILNAILDALPADRSVGIRTPHYKREIFGGSQESADAVITTDTAFDGSKLSRVGHVNDCFLSSPTDVGTYVNPSGQWPVERELDYIGGESLYVPFGGETCSVHARNDSSAAIEEMERLHIDYLNLDWQPDVIQRWKVEGRFDEIERRMGYRFEMVEAKLPAEARPGSALSLELRVSNVGFGELFNERPVNVVLRNNDTGEQSAAQISVDPRRWQGGQTVEIQSELVLADSLADGTYSLGLQLPDAHASLADDSRYSVRFANANVWDAEHGVNWISRSIRLSQDAAGILLNDADSFRELDDQTVSVLGDFDLDGDCDADDLDQLAAAVRAASNDPSFDVDRDGSVTLADHTDLVQRVKSTHFGDADLNGRFDSSDVVQVFQAGKYESNDAAAGWAEGDWNGDGRFTSGDLVLAFADGGYQADKPPAAGSVPEPGLLTTSFVALLLLLRKGIVN